MNPLTNMKNVIKLSEQELWTNNKTSWHDQYKDSAWVFAAGFPYDLTEGDLVCIFSQYGEIVHINLVRDKETGKSRGFSFICYEDQRSTILAVDNLNSIKILNRTLRVDHVANYKVPKNAREEAAKAMPAATNTQPAIKVEPVKIDDYRETLADIIEGSIKLPQRLPIYTIKDEAESVISMNEEPEEKPRKKPKSDKKHKKKKSKKKRKAESDSSESSDDSEKTSKKKSKR